MKVLLSLILILSLLIFVSHSQTTAGTPAPSTTTGTAAPSGTTGTPAPSTNSSSPAHVYNLFEIRNKVDSNECVSHFGNNQTQPFQNVYLNQKCVKGCGGSIKIEVDSSKENTYKLLRWSTDDKCTAAPVGNYVFTCAKPSEAYELDATYTVTCQTDNNPPPIETDAPTQTPKNSSDFPVSIKPTSTPSNSSVPTNKPNEQATTTGNSSSSLFISFTLILISILSTLL